MRESPATEIVHELKLDGYCVEHFDPLVAKMQCGPLAEVARDKDLIAVLVCHDSLRRELEQHAAAIRAAMRHDRIVFFDR
jgi:hypothetical protein